VHLEPVERTGLDGLDQVAGLELRVLPRVAADERRALQDDVVELALAEVVGADCADERALGQPVAAEHRVARGRDRDDDVLLRRICVGAGRLGTHLRAERLQSFRRPAVGDDPLE
jgi:hypothetical protein